MRRFYCITTLVILHVTGATLANASQLFSFSGIQGLGLHSIDQATGEPIRVMDLSFVVADLASNGQLGNEFVWSVTNFPYQLAKIRPGSEEVVSAVALDTFISAVAIDPSDLTFFGVGGTQLFEISPDTGEVTLIGDLSPAVNISSLTFDLNGTLFGIGTSSLYSISTSDASVNIINDMLPASSSLVGIAVRPGDGTMFIVSFDGSYKLFTVDPANGSLTTVGLSLSRPVGLAFAVIPEPSTASLLVTLTIFGIIVRQSFEHSRV